MLQGTTAGPCELIDERVVVLTPVAVVLPNDYPRSLPVSIDGAVT
jgi:hypothetical protein